jgi:hypothetical protein
MLDEEQNVLVDLTADARARHGALELQRLAVAPATEIDNPKFSTRHRAPAISHSAVVCSCVNHLSK